MAEQFGAGMLLACGVFAAVAGVTKIYLFTTAAIVLLGFFMVWEIRSVPAQQLLTAIVLFSVGSVAVLPSNEFLDVLLQACEGTLIFVALFTGITFLQYPALNSPSLNEIRDFIVRQPSGRRYLILSIAAHFLGALINLSAMGLLTTFLYGKIGPSDRQRMACAMIRGFSLASIWSPFFISIAVILHIKPELQWWDIAIPGFPMSALLLFYSWAYDRIFSHHATPTSATATPTDAMPKLPIQAVVKIAFLGIALSVLFIMSSKTLEVSIPIAIILVTPAIAIGWQFLLSKSGTRGGMPDMSHTVSRNIGKLRSQVLIFISANFLGYGAARVIDPELISSTLLGAGIESWAAIFLLLATMLICTTLMLHPLALIILVGQVFPAEVLGVHNISLAMCMVLVWGIATTSSPASGLTLFMTRVMGESLWRIGWIWNGGYAFGGCIIGAVYISFLNHWLLQ